MGLERLKNRFYGGFGKYWPQMHRYSSVLLRV
jgi:hypothetical protein